MTLIEKIQSVVRAYTSFDEQLQLVLRQQAEYPAPDLTYAVERATEILQVQSIISLVECAKQLMFDYRGLDLKVKLARIHAGAAIEGILERFKNRISSENNITDLFTFSREVKNAISPFEQQLKKINQAVIESTLLVKEQLDQDHPDKMLGFETYSDIIIKLTEIENEKNAAVQRNMQNVQDYLAAARLDYAKFSRPFKQLKVEEALENNIKEALLTDKVAWPDINENVYRCLLESIKKFALNVFSSCNPIENDYIPRSQEVSSMFAKYNNFVDSVRDMLSSFGEVSEEVRGIQQELNDQVIGQTPLIKDAKRRAIEFYDDHQQRYTNFRERVGDELTNGDNEMTRIKEEFDKNFLKALKILKIASDRFNVEEREFKLIKEHLAFARKNFIEVNGEYFQKIKEKIQLDETVKEMLEKIKRFVRHYPDKAGDIHVFLNAFDNSGNLQGLQRLLEIGLQDKNLSDHPLAIAKFFGRSSSFVNAIKVIQNRVEDIIAQERQDNKIYQSIRADIAMHKRALFPATRVIRFEVVSKALLKKINVVKNNHPVLEKLKGELFEISCWKNKDTAKISRMMREIKHSCAYLSTQSSVAGKAALGELKQFLAEAKEALVYQESDFPFSVAYQKLKAYLPTIKTLRSANDLWEELDKIAEGSGSEAEKFELMRQKVLDYYYAIRRSKNGSDGVLFGHGSKLGDALERFLTHSNGLNVHKYLVPHRIQSSQMVPNLKYKESDALWVEFKF